MLNVNKADNKMESSSEILSFVYTTFDLIKFMKINKIVANLIKLKSHFFLW